jgi:hypothetical protein
VGVGAAYAGFHRDNADINTVRKGKRFSFESLDGNDNMEFFTARASVVFRQRRALSLHGCRLRTSNRRKTVTPGKAT